MASIEEIKKTDTSEQTHTSDIDPSLFQKGREEELSQAVVSAAQNLEQTGDALRSHEVADEGSRLNAQLTELEELADDADTSEGDGGILGSYVKGRGLGQTISQLRDLGILDNLGDTEEPSVSERQLQTAREQAGARFIELTDGLQQHLEQGLTAAGFSAKEASETAWVTTWNRLKKTLSGEGTLLAEVAGFFDDVAKTMFGKDFKQMDEDRGPAVSANVRFRTFYEIMNKHVHRAAIASNSDAWTGWK